MKNTSGFSSNTFRWSPTLLCCMRVYCTSFYGIKDTKIYVEQIYDIYYNVLYYNNTNKNFQQSKQIYSVHCIVQYYAVLYCNVALRLSSILLSPILFCARIQQSFNKKNFLRIKQEKWERD